MRHAIATIHQFQLTRVLRQINRGRLYINAILGLVIIDGKFKDQPIKHCTRRNQPFGVRRSFHNHDAVDQRDNRMRGGPVI